ASPRGGAAVRLLPRGKRAGGGLFFPSLAFGRRLRSGARRSRRAGPEAGAGGTFGRGAGGRFARAFRPPPSGGGGGARVRRRPGTACAEATFGADPCLSSLCRSLPRGTRARAGGRSAHRRATALPPGGERETSTPWSARRASHVAEKHGAWRRALRPGLQAE